MILRGLINVCEVDYVVRAPDGKEVEELTRKDIIKALRAKVPIDQVIPKINGNGGFGHGGGRYHQEQRRDSRFQQQPQQQPQPPQREVRVEQQQHAAPVDNRLGGAPRQQERDRSILSPSEISRKLLNKEPPQQATIEPMKIDPELGIKDINREDPEGMDAIPVMEQKAEAAVEQRYVESLTELHNTLRGRLYDHSGNMIVEVPIRELIQAIQDASDIQVVVFDGIITQRLIELANKRRVSAIYGIRAGQVSRMFDSMLLYTKEQGKLG